MKKKKWIFIISSVLLIIALLISIIFYMNYKKEEKIKQEHLKLVENTKRKYNYFALGKETKDSTDKISVFFNNIIKEQEKDKAINFNKYIEDNLNIVNIASQDFINALNEEIKNYDISVFNDFTEENLARNINSSVDKDTLIHIFNSNNYIKNISQERKVREDYINKLNELKTYLEYLQNNKDKYSIQDKTIIYKDENIKDKLEEFKNKYNLDINIKKEEIKKVSQQNSNVNLKTANGVPILCYHGILDNPWGQASLFVKVNEFDAQMKYLREQGYTTLFTSEISSAQSVEKPIIITFDDGYKDVYTNALPILKKYNLKANVYMISGWINGDVYMTSDMTKEMANSSLIEIGSHTVNHKALATLSDEDIESELKNSKENLESMLNKSIDVIAYPTGSYDNRVLNITKKYYKYGLSTNKGKENPNNLNTYKLNRIYVYRSYNIEQFKNLF